MTSPFSTDASALLQHHWDMLHVGSGIAAEVIIERGYRSVLGRKELADLGYSPAQQRTPGLLIPLQAPDGSPAGYTYRPDNPRRDKKGKLIKYENPAAGAIRLDVPPPCRAALGDPSVPLWWTEGAKKADAAASRGLCCVNLSGVWGFKGRNLLGGTVVVADFDRLTLKGRDSVICYDSDIMDKTQVRQAMDRLAEHLSRKEARVFIARLPEGEDGAKVGLDDYLLTHTLDELLARRRAFEPQAAAARLYECREAGLGYVDADGEWRVIIPAATTILAMEQEAEGDAAATFTLGVQINGMTRTLRLSSNDLADARSTRAAFLSLGVALAPSLVQHVAGALLATSSGFPQIRVYRRIGWEHGTYIAPGREPHDTRVALPQHIYVNLSGDDWATASKALVALLTAMPAKQTTLIVAQAFLSAMARPAGLDRYKFGLHITGRTGTLKTSYACALLGLWAGADWTLQPVLKWGEGATNNAIMAHAAHLADSLVLIDNYKPGTGGGAREFVALLHNILEGAERERLTRQSTLRQSRELHAWPLTTGEDIPRRDAASMARLLVVQFEWSGGQNEMLADAQAGAHALPAVMKRWIGYLETQSDDLKRLGAVLVTKRATWATWLLARRPQTVNALRLATNLALQEIAWEAMLGCADLRPIIRPYSADHAQGLRDTALEMGAETAEALEANVWLEALADVLSSKRAYVSSLDGLLPDSDASRTARFIGWQDADFYYLVPTATNEEVFEALRRSGQQLFVTAPTLYKQLEQLGVLVSGGDGRHQILKWISGAPRRALCIRRQGLGIESDDDGVDV